MSEKRKRVFGEITDEFKAEFDDFSENWGNEMKRMNLQTDQIGQLEADNKRLMDENLILVGRLGEASPANGNTQVGESNDQLREEYKVMEGKYAGLVEGYAKIREENREQLDIILSHIGQRSMITTKQAEEGYQGVIGAIGQFLSEWIEDILTDITRQNESLSWIRAHKESVVEFKDRLSQHKDLYDAALNFPNLELDSDIIIAFILRTVVVELFAMGFHAYDSQAVRVLEMTQDALRNYEDPTEDDVAVRTWEARTRSALLAHPEIKQERENIKYRTSRNLAHVLRFIIQDADFDQFADMLIRDVLDPAFKLQDRYLATHIVYNLSSGAEVQAGRYFEGELSQLEAVRISNYATINLPINTANMNPAPDAAQLRNELYVLFSLHPALIRAEPRAIKLGEPVIAIKENFIGYWKPGERAIEAMHREKRDNGPWLYQVLTM